MTKFEIIDTFPAFLAYWKKVQNEPVDVQIKTWALDYMSQWPELLKKQQDDYASDNEDWRQIACERIFPFLSDRLPAMQEAHESGSLKAVFVDDPDVRKLWHGAKSVLTSPDRLWSDYYSGRPGVHEAREDGKVRDSVLSMLEWVQAGLDGTVPVWWPAHPWATDTALHSQMLSHGRADQSSIEGLALTPAVLATDVSRVMVDHGDGWVEETLYSTEPMVFDPSSTRYALPYKSTPTVDDNVRMYQLSYGVVQGTTGNRGFGGWWTPTPALAALAERIFLTTSNDGKEIGGPYYRIPSEVEDLGTDDYRALQGEQRSYLEERSWTMEKLRTTLTGALGA